MAARADFSVAIAVLSVNADSLLSPQDQRLSLACPDLMPHPPPLAHCTLNELISLSLRASPCPTPVPVYPLPVPPALHGPHISPGLCWNVAPLEELFPGYPI